MSTADPRRLPTRSDWFAPLPAEVTAQLAGLSVTRRYGNGALLHAKGDPPDGLYCVVSGRVRIGSVGANGRELLIGVLEPGSWWGEISLLDGLPRTHDAHAIGDTEILLLPQARFQALLDRQPQLYRYFARMLCDKLRLAFAHIEESALLSLSERLARRLLLLADIYGEDAAGGRRITLHLPQEALGQMLGTSRQSISRLLKGFEARGWIALEYGRVTIRDAQGLESGPYA